VPSFTIPQLRPNQVAIIIGALGVLTLVIFAFFLFRKPTVTLGTPVSLTVWGTEPIEEIQPLLESYKTVRPNITMVYTEYDAATYRDRLINALAEGTGPDVFMLQSTDIGVMKSKLAPAPASLTLATVQNTFPKAVESAAIDDGAIYGLPLSLDTLVLLYNRDLLDGAGITTPPSTWDGVVSLVPRLAAVDDQHQVQRAAIALGGTSQTIADTADILSLLMIQNGSKLTNQAHSSIEFGAEGDAALRFYTQFGNPASATYTWNDALGDSYRALADGKVAMLITYPQALKTIKNLNPFADIRMSAVPQASSGTPRSYGTFPLLVVSKQSPNMTWAWDVVQGLTTNKELMATYTQTTGKASALNSVITDQIAQPDTTLIGTQALQARAWFPWDGALLRTEMDRAITDVLSGVVSVTRALQTADQRIESLAR
jgi:ABC-type glycerol-3-phosphate transport system substrate-binding protein